MPREERAHERYAWLIFFVVGIAFAAYAVALLFVPALSWPFVPIVSLTSNNGVFGLLVNLLWVHLGIYGIAFDALVVAISLTGYRTGRRWAWYAFLAVALAWILGTGAEISLGVANLEFESNFALIILFTVGLMLPYRRFFPLRPTVKPANMNDLLETLKVD